MGVVSSQHFLLPLITIILLWAPGGAANEGVRPYVVMPVKQVQVCQLPERGGECIPMGILFDSGSYCSIAPSRLFDGGGDESFEEFIIKPINGEKNVEGVNVIALIDPKVSLPIPYMKPKDEVSTTTVAGGGESGGDPLSLPKLEYLCPGDHRDRYWQLPWAPKLLIGMTEYNELSITHAENTPYMFESIFGKTPHTAVYTGSFLLDGEAPESERLLHYVFDGKEWKCGLKPYHNYREITAPEERLLPLMEGKTVEFYSKNLDPHLLHNMALEGDRPNLHWILGDAIEIPSNDFSSALRKRTFSGLSHASPPHGVFVILHEVVQLTICKPHHLLTADEQENPAKVCRKILAAFDTGAKSTAILHSLAEKELHLKLSDSEDIENTTQAGVIQVKKFYDAEVQIFHVGVERKNEAVLKLDTYDREHILGRVWPTCTMLVPDHETFKALVADEGIAAASPPPPPHVKKHLRVLVVEPVMVIGSDLWEKIMREPVVTKKARYGLQATYYQALGAWSLRGVGILPEEWVKEFRAEHAAALLPEPTTED